MAMYIFAACCVGTVITLGVLASIKDVMMAIACWDDKEWGKKYEKSHMDFLRLKNQAQCSDGWGI